MHIAALPSSFGGKRGVGYIDALNCLVFTVVPWIGRPQDGENR